MYLWKNELTGKKFTTRYNAKFSYPLVLVEGDAPVDPEPVIRSTGALSVQKLASEPVGADETVEEESTEDDVPFFNTKKDGVAKMEEKEGNTFQTSAGTYVYSDGTWVKQ